MAAVAAAAVLAGLSAGEAGGAAGTLSTRLNRALTVPGISWSATGATVLDLRTGRLVFGRNGRLSLRPASNEKLGVALAALDLLGPTARITTEVLGEGRQVGSVWRGRLVLKGHGDPTLMRRDLAQLARGVRLAGIRRVAGRIVGDESFFDRRRTARGWKPSFFKRECPPLSALVVDRGNLRGRTVDDPALVAARQFRRALLAAGVRNGGAAAKGIARAGAVRIARDFSPTIAVLVRRMNRTSDNFVAETLLKYLGARELGRGTTPAGAALVRRVLAARGVPLAGVRIVDGSGLSALDRLTPRALVALLVSAYRDPALRRPLLVSLPVAGVSGTLEDRMTRGPARGRVRAKTGTTDTASALSGFVGRKYVFSVLQNGSPIPWWWARRGQDRFAQILAARLP